MNRALSSGIVAILILISLLGTCQSVSFASGGYKELDQSTFATLERPVGLAWTGNGFIASDRSNLSAASLATISPDGKNVTPFAPSFSTKNGSMEDYIAVSNGKAGFPSRNYFVLSFDSIFEINLQNNQTKLFSTPVKNQQLSYIVFDTVGSWGYQLLALYQNGMIWSVNSSGSAIEIASIGPNQNPENLVIAPAGFGNFSGDLIVSEEIGNHSVIAIPSDNRSDEIAIVKFPAEAIERVLEIQKNSDLYVAKYDQGVIQKFPAGDFSNFSSSSLLVITEGESGQNGSMDILSASGESVLVTTILLESDPHFEGAIFVPSNESAPNVTSSSSSSNPVSSTTSSSMSSVSTIQSTSSGAIDQTGPLVIVVIVAIVAIGAAFVLRRARR